MNPRTRRSTMSSLLVLAGVLALSIACKQPKGREWDNAYPDQPGTLDVDGPPRVRADEKWLDRRTAPDPIVEEEKKTDETTKQEEPGKKDGD